MNRIARWGFALALLPIAACSDSRQEMTTSNPTPPAATASATDTMFMNQAAMMGLGEVQAHQLAVQKGGPRVKPLAQYMLNVHNQQNAQLMQVAQAKGVTPPTSIDPTIQQQIDALQKLSGPRFDHEYLTTQLADHNQTIALFQREIAEGTDPELKGFAQQNLPEIQSHTQKIEALLHARGTAAPHHAPRHHR